jgi:hypothetical protein
MEPRHLYTLRWTQPYSTDQLRPYLRALQLELEASIEALLDEMEYTEAKAVIERIMKL